MRQDPLAPPRLAPNIDEAAFLLDFDGTLVDIAPSPEQVQVPDGLRQLLHRLRARVGDALAVVTGRPIDQVDHYLPGVPYAIAGEHGVAMRYSPDGPIVPVTLPAMPAEWLDAARALAEAHAGIRIEPKRAGLVLHYRGNPAAGDILEQAAQAMVSASEGRFHVQASKMAWEIRPVGFDKGGAVRLLMQQAPFTGRRPVFIGDDVTDEDGIQAAIALGGAGYKIPEDFPDTDAVRAWLGRLADGEVPAWHA